MYINYGQFLLSFHLSRKIKIKIYAFIIVGRENLELSRVGEEYKPSVFHKRTLRKTNLKVKSHIACHAHAAPMPFSCHAVPLSV